MEARVVIAGGAHEFEIAALASSRERRNRPMGFLAVAGAALLASGVFSIWAVAKTRGAQSAHARASGELVRVRELAAEIEALEGADAQTDARFRPVGRPLTKLNASLDASELTPRPTLNQAPDQRPTVMAPLVRKIFTSKVSDVDDLGAYLRWLTSAQKAIEGLFISKCILRPTPKGWYADVEFSRWELSS